MANIRVSARLRPQNEEEVASAQLEEAQQQQPPARPRAVMVAKDASSEKRLAYIARRIRFLQELVRLRIVDVLQVPGKANPADALTKHLTAATFKEYMARMYNTSVNTFS